jgi:D-glycero-D-manno-heptose 1,7-bisphosphate phosphatase
VTAPGGRGVVFLDRDGVINEFPGKGLYVTTQEAFRFLPRALEAIRLLTAADLDLFVISNQGCVSRGLLSKADLDRMTERMVEAVRGAGGRLAGVFYCVHQTSDACECKKPKTLLFRRAVEGRGLDFSSAYFVGDSREDMEAGKALGMKTVLVLSGRTGECDAETLGVRPNAVKRDLWEAAQWILEKRS